MVSNRVMLDVPRELIWFVSGLLAARRRQIGTRKGTRRLGCYRQALFALAWFRDKGDIARLGRGFGLSQSTACRYLDEVMLAAYLTWHLRKAFAPLTFTDEEIPQPADPVIPAQRTPQAAVKDAVKETPDGLPLYRYRDLLEHLATLDRQVINFAGQQIEKITTTTPVQARAFDLLGSPVPARLT